METIMPKYGKHYQAIKTIGKLPLSKELLLSDIGDAETMKKVVQACYYEMKKENLDISVVDYLCRVATLFLVEQVGKNHKDILMSYEKNKEEVRCFVRYFMKDPFFFLPKFDTKTFQEIAVFWYGILNSERIKESK